MFYIIPAIDLYENQVVRLYKGKYDQVTVYYKDPLDVVLYFRDCGIQRIHIVDLNAARDGNTNVNRKTIENIIKQKGSLKLEIGGGIRNKQIVHEYIDAGIEYLILGTIAVKSPSFVEELLNEFNRERFIIGVDAKNEEVKISGWEEGTKLNLFDFIKKIEFWGISQIIVTDIDRDGTLQGPNISLLKKILERTTLKVISSGGISSNQDILDLYNLYRTNENLMGTIVGKAFYEKKVDLKELLSIVH
ncbi:MAG: 1-(5-phosphoribosyl)-5-[(5-phosphoribosylamino)methylideneamino]imidazole-4-carboxamide isomerase [Leptospiraceae bacterium]|jgi:phosphoribosylformimino-5-aminoimidazole carboxamide ribotide isomerase|nr:1-(5-phosphoribosyl)-5-[(5-phosphoribosylamino)methylideneamino]imidazole-4-carboxamide isomerase [Leptospiraceae bacterium]